MAFDNEQKGQKNYLDHGYNTVIYYTITSFVLLNYDLINQIQNLEDPWLHKIPLNALQLKNCLILPRNANIN